jgi:hypothetical protein
MQAALHAGGSGKAAAPRRLSLISTLLAYRIRCINETRNARNGQFQVHRCKGPAMPPRLWPLILTMLLGWPMPAQTGPNASNASHAPQHAEAKPALRRNASSPAPHQGRPDPKHPDSWTGQGPAHRSPSEQTNRSRGGIRIPALLPEDSEANRTRREQTMDVETSVQHPAGYDTGSSQPAGKGGEGQGKTRGEGSETNAAQP